MIGKLQHLHSIDVCSEKRGTLIPPLIICDRIPWKDVIGVSISRAIWHRCVAEAGETEKDADSHSLESLLSKVQKFTAHDAQIQLIFQGPRFIGDDQRRSEEKFLGV